MKEIIDFKYLDKGKDKLQSQRHSHGRSYEMLFVRSGNGVVMVRDKLFSLKSGAVYFINGMETHCSVPENPDDYLRGKIIISGNFIDETAAITGCTEIISELFLKNGGTCVEPEESVAKYIDTEWVRIRNALAEASVYTKINLISAVFNIITAAHANRSSHAKALDNRVADALEYINKNIGHEIILDEICEHIHVSKYYLCHIFKKTTGMTVFEYILSRRLSIARQYLLENELSLSEIANTAGFSSFSYFSKSFRKYEGVTPREFRKKAKAF